MQPQSLCAHVCVIPVLSIRPYVFSIPSGSYSISASSSTEFFESCGEAIDGDGLFRAESSKMYHYLCIFQLWISVFVSKYCRRKLLLKQGDL